MAVTATVTGVETRIGPRQVRGKQRERPEIKAQRRKHLEESDYRMTAGQTMTRDGHGLRVLRGSFTLPRVPQDVGWQYIQAQASTGWTIVRCRTCETSALGSRLSQTLAHDLLR